MEAEQKKPKTFRRTLQILAVGVVVYFFVIPLIPGFRQAIDDLHTINPYLLVSGIGLQGFSLFAYSLLTKAALGEHGDDISSARLFRIQLSTKALGNIVPGGSAASSALGYRLITMCGIPGPDAAFALATAGIGSAVVLNLILWFGLIVSIPFRGVNAAYGTAAIVGVIFMAFAAFLIFGLLEGQGRSERIVRGIARRLRFDEHHAAEVLAHLGSRIEGLFLDKQLLRRVIGWATANWLLDAFSLWVFLRAFGGNVGFDGLIVAFGLANVFSVVPITPASDSRVAPQPLEFFPTELPRIGCRLWWVGSVICRFELAHGQLTVNIACNHCRGLRSHKPNVVSALWIGWKSTPRRTAQVSSRCLSSSQATWSSRMTIRMARPVPTSVCSHDNT